MPRPTLLNLRGAWYVGSFASGFTKCTTSRSMTETDALALALWLERHGREDEALYVLDRYCAGYRIIELAPP